MSYFNNNNNDNNQRNNKFSKQKKKETISDCDMMGRGPPHPQNSNK